MSLPESELYKSMRAPDAAAPRATDRAPHQPRPENALSPTPPHAFDVAARRSREGRDVRRDLLLFAVVVPLIVAAVAAAVWLVMWLALRK